MIFNISGQNRLPKYNIKVNLPNLPFMVWNVQAEYLMKYHSIQVGYAKADGSTFIDTDVEGHFVNLEYRIYLQPEKKFTGTYFSPYLRWQNIYFEGTGDGTGIGKDIIQVNNIGGGLVLGRVAHPFKIRWLVLDYFAGVNYIPKKYDVIELTSGIPPNSHSFPLPPTLYGLGVRVGIALGVRF
jgi:hypothetical protein